MKLITQIAQMTERQIRVACSLVLAFSVSACDSLKFDNATLAKINDTEGMNSAPLGLHVLGEISEQRWVFTNTGNIYAKITGHTDLAPAGDFRYKGGEFPGTGGICSEILQPGESCVIFTEFQPAFEGLIEKSWVLSYSNGAENVQFPFTIRRYVGEPAFLEVAEGGEYNFPVTELNNVTKKTFTIRNIGGLTASAIATRITTGAQFSLPPAGDRGTCGNTLPAKSSCTMNLYFTPAAQGSHNDVFNISYNNAQTDQTIGVVITGISAQIAANMNFIGNTTYSFGSSPLGKTLVKKVNLVNNGFVVATNFHFENDTNYSIQSTTCPATIAIAETCEAIIAFNPSTLGALDGSIVAKYESGQGPLQSTYTLNGTGVKPAEVTVKLDLTTTIPSYSYGTLGVGDELEAKFILANVGQVNAEGLSVTTLPGSPFTIKSLFCSNKLTPGVSCEVRVLFKPTAEVVYNSALRIAYDNGATAFVNPFPISGEGIGVGVIRFLDAPQINMGQLAIGNYADFVVTIENQGLGSALSIPAPVMPGDVSFAGGAWPGIGGSCPASLPFSMNAGQTCTFVIRFAPSVRSTYFGTIDITYDNEVAPVTQKLSIYGEGRNDALLEFLVTNPYNYGSLPTNAPQVFAVSVQNNGDYTANNLSVVLSGSTQLHFAGGAYPGVNPKQMPTPAADISNYCGTAMSRSSSCNIYLEYTAATPAVISTTVTYTYDGQVAPTKSTAIVLQAEAKALGYLEVTPLAYDTFTFPNTARGGTITLPMTMKNTGLAPLTITNIDQTVDPYRAEIETTNCLAVLNPNQTCTLNVRYSPVINGTTSKFIKIDYNDGEVARSINQALSGTGVNPASIIINPSMDFDYGLVVVNTTKNASFIVRNSGGVDATALTFAAPTGPYTVFSNNCPTDLQPYQQCTVVITFTPVQAGLEVGSVLTVGYGNGITTTNVSRNYKGTGEPPLHQHRGWTKIFAIGESVNTLNISQGDRRIEISWADMIKNGGTMTSYSVYRRTLEESYDFTAPIASNISLTAKTFTDNTITPGTVYFYTVKPIIDGFPSRSTANYAEIKVTAPPHNMSLIHRTMANKYMCELVGKTPDPSNNNRCAYTALGNKLGYMDIGYDYMVDRYELGQDGTSNYGQIPNAGHTQIQANDQCKNQNGITISGINSRTFTKTLLSRKEHLIAALWPTTMTSAQIIAAQEGSLASALCNGNSTGLDQTGVNTGCVSRWGVENMAGNAWEWVSDRLYDGRGVNQDSLKLDTANKDLDNVNFLNLQTASYLSTMNCLAPALMLPVESSGGSCPTDTVSPSDFGATNLYNGRYFTPGNVGARFVAVGGSFIKASTYPSIFTTAFLDPSLPVGAARCGFRIE